MPRNVSDATRFSERVEGQEGGRGKEIPWNTHSRILASSGPPLPKGIPTPYKSEQFYLKIPEGHQVRNIWQSSSDSTQVVQDWKLDLTQSHMVPGNQMGSTEITTALDSITTTRNPLHLITKNTSPPQCPCPPPPAAAWRRSTARHGPPFQSSSYKSTRSSP